MQADSMNDRRAAVGTIATTTRTTVRSASIRRVVMIAAACLIQAILVLGFVAASLGLGAEDHVGVGPDRPPVPLTRPDPAR